jgi:YD repeat-containing protein
VYQGNQTIVKDPRGLQTTLSFTRDQNVSRVLDTAGQRTSYTWSAGRVRSVQDPRGKITTFTYATMTDGTQRLQQIITPVAGRFSYTYNANNLLTGLMDQLGRRSTLLWDGNGNRTAVINSLGQRTSYRYDSFGQLKVFQNSLGQPGGGWGTSTPWVSAPRMLTTPSASGVAGRMLWETSPPSCATRPTG